MEEIVFEANRREVIGKKVKALRREGKLPAIIYGQDLDPIPITLETKQVQQILKEIGANTLVTIKIGKKEHLALVRDIQREVIMRDLLQACLSLPQSGRLPLPSRSESRILPLF